jgi:hypothetical protein
MQLFEGGVQRVEQGSLFGPLPLFRLSGGFLC